MAAFVSRYATAFLEVVTAAKLDAAAIDQRAERLSCHLGRKPRAARVFSCIRPFPPSRRLHFWIS